MKRLSIVILALAVSVAGCDTARPKTVQKTETIMGTDVTITVVAKNKEQGEAAIDAGMAELRRLDEMMSLYKDTSEITKVNLAAGKNPVKVSPEMIEIVERATEVSKLTNGVFDITVGPLVVLWQMRLKEGKIPTDQEIAKVRHLVNYNNVVIDKKTSTLFLRKPRHGHGPGRHERIHDGPRRRCRRKSRVFGTPSSRSPEIFACWGNEMTARRGGSACSTRASPTRSSQFWT